MTFGCTTASIRFRVLWRLKKKRKRTLLHQVNKCCVVFAILGPAMTICEDSADLSKLVVKKNRPFLLSVTLILQKHTSLQRVKVGEGKKVTAQP